MFLLRSNCMIDSLQTDVACVILFYLVKGKGTWIYISPLDDTYLVLQALRHGSHSVTCKQHHARL